MKTLILTHSDIVRLICMKDALKTATESFRILSKGQLQMPAKTYLHLDKYQGDFRAMPAYVEDIEACGIKWVNVHPMNRKKGLPTVMALVILNDPATGVPLCIMDGTWLTNLRTGAAGGLAARCLARRGSSRIALVGCGAQAKTQLMALNEVFAIESVKVWGLNKRGINGFRASMKFLGLKMEAAKAIKECVKDCDIVVTTTPSRRPLVKSEWVGEGVHINAIGADAKGKEELDPELLLRARIFVDDLAMAEHSGEINVPFSKGLIKETDIAGELSQVLMRKKKGRLGDSDITIFDSTGLAVLDVMLASLIYKRAVRANCGRRVQFAQQVTSGRGLRNLRAHCNA